MGKLSVNTNIQIKSWEVNVSATQNAGDITPYDIVFPVDIKLIRGSFFNKPEFLGDFAAMHVGPETLIGAVVASASVGDEWLTVSDTVIANLERGYFIIVEGNDLGQCLEIDEAGSRVRVAPIANAIDVSGGIKFLRMTIQFVPHIYLEGTNTKETLEGGDEPSYIPKNTTIRIFYTNNNLTAKTFSLRLEWHY